MHRLPTRRLGTGLLGTLLAVLSISCIVGPRPEPPQATIDADRINDGWTYGATIIGSEGAASPVGALVRAYNLDSEIDPGEGLVDEEGRFEIDLLFVAGDEVRIQVISDEARSEPIDLLVGPDGSSLSGVDRALGDCLTLDPPAQLDLDGSSSLAVTNRCGEEITLEQPAPRRAVEGLQLGEGVAWPATLPDGDSITVNVAVEMGTGEEIFFIEASAPERDRRPITFVPPP